MGKNLNEDEGAILQYATTPKAGSSPFTPFKSALETEEDHMLRPTIHHQLLIRESKEP